MAGVLLGALKTGAESTEKLGTFIKKLSVLASMVR